MEIPAQFAGTGAPPWLDELSLAPGPPWHAMGIRSLDEAAWLLADDRRGVELAEKRRLLDTARDVVSAGLPGAATDAATAEAAALVGAASGHVLDPDRPALEAAALVVQEDLCVLVRSDSGWRLDAGVVCFPSMWRLTDKLGLSMASVHTPVPAYADELAAKVDRFLDRMQPDRPVWRRNWFIHSSAELHQPAPPPPPPVPPVVPDGLWLRSERQTLRRLPRTGAVLFTIRTQQVPLSVIAEGHDIAIRRRLARAMAAAMQSWSDELVAYRGAGPWIAPTVTWLTGLAMS